MNSIVKSCYIIRIIKIFNYIKNQHALQCNTAYSNHIQTAYYQVYVVNFDDEAPVFNSILNDPLLGTTTGVINGIGAKKSDVLYLDVFGSVNGATTPKVMTATPN